MELCSNCKFFFLFSIVYSNFIIFPVDADEIRRLGKRFRKLDLDNSGALSIDEFMSLPELQQNPLVQRVIDIFDADGNGEVDFKGLLHCYCFFSAHRVCIFVLRIYPRCLPIQRKRGQTFQATFCL